jgi:hypothetical protein
MEAFYNPLTDEIIGAEPGTILYLHECGHQFLQRKFKYYFYAQYIERALIFAFLLAVAQGQAQSLKILAGLYFLFMVWDEMFAWFYAFYNIIGTKRL